MPPQNTPAPAAPSPAQGPAATSTPAPIVDAAPDVIYKGVREKREVLFNQKSRLEDERREIVEQLQQPNSNDVARQGLEQRLAAVDQRIAQVSINIAEADAEVALASAVPGALREEAPRDRWAGGPPPELVAMGLFLTAALFFPIVLAHARRIWRKANVVSVVPPELTDRVAGIERNLDAVALEIERIGEGQRFVTQLMSQRADRAPQALPEPGTRTD
jgi:hypothetical protein